MQSLPIWFIVIGIVFVGIPLMLLALFIIRVVRKSIVKPSKETVDQQKRTMLSKIKSAQQKLIKWEPALIECISNRTDYNFVKGIYQKYNGYILSSEDERIIAFRRIDHGLSIDSKITAATSNKLFYFEASPKGFTITINGQYLGNVDTEGGIHDAKGNVLGKMYRKQSVTSGYLVELNGKDTALIAKNSDSRRFVKNPLHQPHSNSPITGPVFWEKEVLTRDTMIKTAENVTPTEYEWLLALTIYEIVSFGIDFTQ